MEFLSPFWQPTNMWLIDYKASAPSKNYIKLIETNKDAAIKQIQSLSNDLTEKKIRDAIDKINEIFDEKMSKLLDYKRKMEHAIASLDRWREIAKRLLLINSDADFLNAHFINERYLSISLAPHYFDVTILDDVTIQVVDDDIAINQSNGSLKIY